MTDNALTPLYIIDDDPSIAMLIEKTLSHKGYSNIRIANNGTDALALLNIQDPDMAPVYSGTEVVILDIMLPDVNGLELCQKIKKVRPDTLVVMISGYDIEELNKHLIDSGADDFLTKPFSPIELAARIDLLLEKYKRNRIHESDKKDTTEVFKAPGHQVPHIGDTIDEFLIIDSLGWGKSSVIYKVLEKPGSKVYALKLLTRYSLDFQDVVQRFQHEVDIMARFNHPNIIKFYKMGNFSGCPYFLMDYIFGINLEESLVTMGLPDLNTIMMASKQLAGGLAAIHDQNILHRDIKLKNIMVEPQNNLFKITDFGISKCLEEGSNLTRDGFIVGTPIYMAPEIFNGEVATIQSDIYSYGVSMYQYAAGIPPFSAKKNSELYQKHLKDIPQPIYEHNPEVPVEFSNMLIEYCMAKDPDDRPESIREIAEMLNIICERYSITASAV